MFFRPFIYAGLLICPLLASAVDFNKLDRNRPISTKFETAENCVVDVNLTLDARTEDRKDFYLRLVYIIDADTLTDLNLLNADHKGVVKRLRLEALEKLEVLLYLHDRGQETLTDISGKLTIDRDQINTIKDENSLATFTGTVWNRQQVPLFRIVKADNEPQTLVLKFDLTENFDFDKLMFNLKVINPALGIQVVSKDVVVNSGPTTEHKARFISIELPEVKINESGTFYLQISQRMKSKRINGVKKVHYLLQ